MAKSTLYRVLGGGSFTLDGRTYIPPVSFYHTNEQKVKLTLRASRIPENMILVGEQEVKAGSKLSKEDVSKLSEGKLTIEKPSVIETKNNGVSELKDASKVHEKPAPVQIQAGKSDKKDSKKK